MSIHIDRQELVYKLVGMKKRTIGAYEAKTRLPEILREVQAGYTYTITKHGKPVAMLMPPEQKSAEDRAKAVEAMRKFMDAQPRLDDIDMKALIEDGRL